MANLPQSERLAEKPTAYFSIMVVYQTLTIVKVTDPYTMQFHLKIFPVSTTEDISLTLKLQGHTSNTALGQSVIHYLTKSCCLPGLQLIKSKYVGESNVWGKHQQIFHQEKKLLKIVKTSVYFSIMVVYQTPIMMKVTDPYTMQYSWTACNKGQGMSTVIVYIPFSFTVIYTAKSHTNRETQWRNLLSNAPKSQFTHTACVALWEFSGWHFEGVQHHGEPLHRIYNSVWSKERQIFHHQKELLKSQQFILAPWLFIRHLLWSRWLIPTRCSIHEHWTACNRAHTSMRDRGNPAFFHKSPPWKSQACAPIPHNFLYNNYPQLCATNSEDKHSELRRKIAD